MSVPPQKLRDKLRAMLAARDNTAVTPTAPLSIGDRIDAFLNWTDPFPYRPRPVSPPNPHVPPADSSTPVDEYELKYGGNRDNKRPPISDAELSDAANASADMRDLQAEIDARNRKLTGNSRRKEK